VDKDRHAHVLARHGDELLASFAAEDVLEFPRLAELAVAS